MENAMMTLDVSAELSEQSTSTYCSIKGGDRATKAKLYNASNNPDHKVGDFINKNMGIFNAVKKAIQIFGEPTWEEPIEFTVKQVSVKNGSMLTLDVAE